MKDGSRVRAAAESEERCVSAQRLLHTPLQSGKRDFFQRTEYTAAVRHPANEVQTILAAFAFRNRLGSLEDLLEARIQEELFTHYPELVEWKTEALQLFFRGATIVSMKEGDRLDMENKLCDGLHFMFSGEKRAFKTDKGGKEITLYTVGSGMICPLGG